MRRTLLMLSAPLLLSSVGCGMFQKNRVGPQTTVGPQSAMNSPEPSGRTGKPLPETYVALAEVRVAAAQTEGRSPEDRERLLTEARQTYQMALEGDPKNYAANLGLARISAEVQDKERAVELFRKLTKLYPAKSEAWSEMGIACGRLKDWNASAESFHEATKLDPDNRQYRRMLGLTLARGGRYDESFAWLSKCMPEADAHYNIAMMMKHTKDESGAKTRMELALRADPKFEAARDFLSGTDGGQPDDNGVRAVEYQMPAAPMVAPVPQRREPSPLGGTR